MTTTQTAPLRVAIYCRISEDPLDARVGVEAQETDCRARAQREGWDVVRVYVENNTGASTRTKKQRTQFPAMLDAARRGEFDLILAYSNSRLTRRVWELRDLIDLYEKHGVRVCTIVSGDDDLSTADGRMVAWFKAAADAAEAERTSERVKRRQEDNRAAGGQGTKRAWGWEFVYEGKTRLPDRLHPLEGPLLREGLEMILRGQSIRAVGRHWSDSGALTTSGKEWSGTRVREVLLRPRNAGLLTHEGEVVGEGNWEPVCAPDELEQVAALIRSRATPKVGRPAKALLSGLIVCDRCGSPMLGARQAGGNKAPGAKWALTYKCSRAQALNGACWTSIQRDTAETAVVNMLISSLMLKHPQQINDESPHTARLSALAAALEDVEAKVERLVRAVVAGALTEADVRAARALLNAEADALRDEMEKLVSASAESAMVSDLHRTLWTPGKVSIADAAKVQATLRERFHGLPLDQQRDLIASVGRIVVEPGRAKDRVRRADTLT